MMDRSSAWIRTGIACGVAASVDYPLMIAAPLPAPVVLVLAAAFGPLLAFASVGLFHFVALHRRSVAVEAAVIANIVAAAIFSSMLIVQLAVRDTIRASAVRAAAPTGQWLWSVILGLDVAWDLWIAIGTFLFAWCAWSHPRLGRIVGGAGMAIAIALLALNLWTFPAPPGEAGLIDAGPFVGGWYAVVTIMMLRARRWIRAAAGDGSRATSSP